MDNQLISSGRSVSSLIVHLMLVTKYRKKLFTNPILTRLEEIFNSTCDKWECELIEFNGELDHIHVLIKFTPKIQLSKLVNNLKTVSSRLIRKEFESEIKCKLWKNVLWSGSYFLGSCGGVTIEQLRKYIEHQDRPKSS